MARDMKDFINPAGLLPEKRIPCSTLQLVRDGNLWAVYLGRSRIGLFGTKDEALAVYPKAFVPKEVEQDAHENLGIGA